MLIKEIYYILKCYNEIRKKLTPQDMDFLADNLNSLFASKIPERSFTTAINNGARFESEFDEGWNKCIDTINDLINC